MELLGTFLFPMILFLPFAIGNFYLAKRFNKRGNVFFILSLIPVINIWMFLYVLYLTIFKVLDTLEQINTKDSTEGLVKN